MRENKVGYNSGAWRHFRSGKKGSCRAPGVCIIRIYTERGRERKIIGQTLLFTHVIYFLLFPPRNFISSKKIIYFFHIFLFGVDVMFRQFCCLKVLREIFDVDVPKCVHRRVFTPTLPAALVWSLCTRGKRTSFWRTNRVNTISDIAESTQTD